MFVWVATATLYLFLAVTAYAGTSVKNTVPVTGADGKTYAIILDCPQDKSGKASEFGGSEDSMLGGQRCGKCLIDSNWGYFIKYPYDLLIKGTLVDAKGEPINNHLVHLYLPNGWTIKTRTSKTGFFRFLMGATDKRKGEKPLEIDLGKRHMEKDNKAEFYAFYMMPQDFKPCKAEEKK